MTSAATVQGANQTWSSPWRRRLSLTQDGLLLAIASLFVYVHVSHAVEERSFASIFFAMDQAVLVGIFLTRRRTNTTSTRVWDWVVATIGGWLPLAMRPHETGGLIEGIGVGVQITGLTLVVFALLSLGRSFGVVAANRGLKTGGMYRFVRHPIYAAHTVSLAGFILANVWWPNLVLYAVVTFFQIMRIQAEERVLARTADYASYRQQVRWRLLPGVY